MWRCSTCDDWSMDKCTACASDVNSAGTPLCGCDSGYTFYYNHQRNADCQAEPNYTRP